jgi:hypothetical protein
LLLLLLSQREKEASGLADVPGGSKGKLLEVEYAFTEDRKLRGQLRDPSAIEAQVGLVTQFLQWDFSKGSIVLKPGGSVCVFGSGVLEAVADEEVCVWGGGGEGVD